MRLINVTVPDFGIKASPAVHDVDGDVGKAVVLYQKTNELRDSKCHLGSLVCDLQFDSPLGELRVSIV
ncbi:hypothetical protein [Dactylosporangium sp. NPDC049140]|uniref:hypothetical protein n=1 Tax=Dactylosporangium sp. NPDC049140 TaxID=3155647 RepID=UPI0034045205